MNHEKIYITDNSTIGIAKHHSIMSKEILSNFSIHKYRKMAALQENEVRCHGCLFYIISYGSICCSNVLLYYFVLINVVHKLLPEGRD